MDRVQSQGIEIAFEVSGNGPSVVLGHSYLCSREMWQPQVGPLAARHQVINLDHRGHGASGTISKAFSLYDMVDDVLAVLNHLGVRRAVWAGLSIGGMVALRAALRAPDRVAGLILADTDAGGERLANRLKYSALGWLVRALGMRPVLPQIARQMFGVTTHHTRPELVTQWRDRFAQVDIPSALLTLAALNRRDDIFSRLPEIHAPALVLVGAEDRSLPPARSRRLARALPRARLVEVPGAGHLSSLEEPAAVTDAMLDFLQGASSSAVTH